MSTKAILTPQGSVENEEPIIVFAHQKMVGGWLQSYIQKKKGRQVCEEQLIAQLSCNLLLKL